MSSDSGTLDPAVLVADMDRRAERFETPCGGGSLVWRRWGAGPPLVLAHGGQGAWSHWIRNIDALAVSRTVWAVDLPGSGDSAEPPEPTHASISAVLAQGLRQLFGPGLPVDVAGFSFGGVCAAYLAALHPGVVRRLVLIATGGLDTPLGQFELVRMRGLDETARRAATRANLRALMVRDPEHADDLAVLLQTLNVPRNRLNVADLVLPTRLQEVLPEVSIQVDAIWGEYDAPHPDPALQEAALRRNHPDADFRVIKDAGHWVMYDRPTAFDQALFELLSRPLRT